MSHEDLQELVNEVFENWDDQRMYFVGGTLCVDIEMGDDRLDEVLLLHVDGEASTFSSDSPVVTLLSDQVQLVQQTYLETKGETEYFKENARDLEDTFKRYRNKRVSSLKRDMRH